MRRYNIYVTLPMTGRYEMIKAPSKRSGLYDDTYWDECFEWNDLKTIVPYMKARGWKFSIEPVDPEEARGKEHMITITCGVNHDVRMIDITGVRVIIAQDLNMYRSMKKTFNPLGY